VFLLEPSAVLVTLGLTLGLAMWVKSLLSVGFLFVCIVLILTVLIQKPSGGGLSGAFGSASGSGQTAFGAKTGDALTIFTIVMFVIFVLGGIGMKFVTTPSQPGAAPAVTSGERGGQTAPPTQPPPADVGGPARPPADTPPVPGPGLPEVDPEAGEPDAPAARGGETPEAQPAPQAEPPAGDPGAGGGPGGTPGGEPGGGGGG
jgi:preprotein translocase subunit SecG